MLWRSATELRSTQCPWWRLGKSRKCPTTKQFRRNSLDGDSFSTNLQMCTTEIDFIRGDRREFKRALLIARNCNRTNLVSFIMERGRKHQVYCRYRLTKHAENEQASHFLRQWSLSSCYFVISLHGAIWSEQISNRMNEINKILLFII